MRGWRRLIGGRRLLIGAAVLLLLVVAYFGGSWVFSSKLIGQQFGSDEQAHFADFRLPQPEAVTLTNGKTKLAGWYFANPRAGTAQCAVVMLHGFVINKAVILPFTPMFWDRGCDLYLYDLRSHGESSREFSTYGVHDKEDELLAVDWLAKRTRLPDGRIGLWGVSYGAATSLQAAVVRPDLAFVVADASYASLFDIASFQAGKIFGSWAKIFVPGALLVSGWRAGFDPSRASPEKAVRGLKTPVLLIHSTADEFTPYQQSEKIYARSDHAHTVLALTRWGAPHGESYLTDPVAYTRIVDNFLAKNVPNFGSRQAAATPTG